MISWLSSTRERKLQEEIDRLRRDLIEAQIKLSKCVDEKIDLFTKLNHCTIELQKYTARPAPCTDSSLLNGIKPVPVSVETKKERKKPGPKPRLFKHLDDPIITAIGSWSDKRRAAHEAKKVKS